MHAGRRRVRGVWADQCPPAEPWSLVTWHRFRPTPRTKQAATPLCPCCSNEAAAPTAQPHPSPSGPLALQQRPQGRSRSLPPWLCPESAWHIRPGPAQVSLVLPERRALGPGAARPGLPVHAARAPVLPVLRSARGTRRGPAWVAWPRSDNAHGPSSALPALDGAGRHSSSAAPRPLSPPRHPADSGQPGLTHERAKHTVRWTLLLPDPCHY